MDAPVASPDGSLRAQRAQGAIDPFGKLGLVVGDGTVNLRDGTAELVGQAPVGREAEGGAVEAQVAVAVDEHAQVVDDETAGGVKGMQVDPAGRAR